MSNQAITSGTTLVVVPCGKAKIWDKSPQAGPTAARDVYVGSPFKVNRTYAERFGDRWVILSAKYGLIDPDDIIEEPYNVTFKDVRTNPVGIGTLRAQVTDAHLGGNGLVLALGGKDYRRVLQAAFAPTEVVFPFAGLPLGYALRATKRAVVEGVAIPAH
ncbi:MAG TPA: hypothetical protein VFR68_09035 [Candidatus Dormibacteraeota bacterium]|nr:hypothetical protein [Candidatus Dormibacteraeota bacterium]